MMDRHLNPLSGPTHTSGVAVDNEVTWAYIGAVNTRLYLYGYTSLATKPPFKLQGFSIGARKQDVMYVSLIDGSTQVTYAALISPMVVQLLLIMHIQTLQ